MQRTTSTVPNTHTHKVPSIYTPRNISPVVPVRTENIKLLIVEHGKYGRWPGIYFKPKQLPGFITSYNKKDSLQVTIKKRIFWQSLSKHRTKSLTHQTGKYPVTCFVSRPSGITLVKFHSLQVTGPSRLRTPWTASKSANITHIPWYDIRSTTYL